MNIGVLGRGVVRQRLAAAFNAARSRRDDRHPHGERVQGARRHPRLLDRLGELGPDLL
jgi:hypothetical protein